MRPLRLPVRALLATSLMLALNGCFASEQPLISDQTADTPFADGTHFAEFTNCDANGAGQLLSCTGYKQTGTDTVQVKNGISRFHADTGASVTMNQVLPGSAQQQFDVRFKQIGLNLFVIQMPLEGLGTANNHDPRWTYAIMRRDGNSAYLYVAQCEQNGDAAYVRSGLLTGIVEYLFQPTCEPASLNGLARIFADRIANGQVPDRRFDITP